MTNILITGGKGQLGRALCDLIDAKQLPFQVVAVDADELDITDQEAVNRFVASVNPSFVVNCAAYTAVDKAEEEPERAMAINGTAVGYLARAATTCGARLIHISTDYVFDGTGHKPYRTDHPAHPTSVYGQTKLEGEIAAMYHAPDAIVIRTSWLYYQGGKNFVNTIVQKAALGQPLKVVADQIGSPTYAGDLAKAIVRILQEPSPARSPRLYHYANSGTASWYDFASAIVDLLGLSCPIEPIATTALNLPAPRPHYSVLDCSDLAHEYGITIPWWHSSLTEYLHHHINLKKT
jgi:dTDP-4-dehydrorhamnose reductase